MRPTRTIFALMLVWMALFAAACGGAAKSKTPPTPPTKQTTSPGVPPPSAPDAAKVVRVLQGKVVEVNPKLRFVVVDFGPTGLPSLEQRLSVYRLDQKVGELRVSGPFRGTHAVADILAGEATFGDFVRVY